MRADYKAVEVLSLTNDTKSEEKKMTAGLLLQSQGFCSLMLETVPIVCMRILVLKGLQSS